MTLRERVASSPTEAPFAGGADGLVKLDRDHPGFRDPVYRRRRDAIARQALEYRDGAPVPAVAYTPEEDGVWRTVWAELAGLHARYASAEAIACDSLIALPRDRVPQLSEVNARLADARSPMRMLPVAGLISSRTFLSHLGRGTFLSTQYVRHHSAPLYTPEPDILHELIGHAGSLTHPVFVRLNRLFGEAAATASAPLLERLERLYWYTLEYGLVRERGAVKAYGAGLLSSCGELARFESASRLEPFSIEAVLARPYDPTNYQEVLFVAPSFDAVANVLTGWLESARASASTGG